MPGSARLIALSMKNMDFTLSVFARLLMAAKDQQYAFQTFEAFLRQPAPRTLILRHDIDRSPQRALDMAKLENELGICGTYYFRCVKSSWDEQVVKQVAALGHEIGYHYEDLALTGGDMDAAIRHFEKQLSRMRKICPINTICMHGSPLSRHDNRDLWKQYDYRLFGISGEPYLDLDFNRVFYLTDTGRRWDGHRVSLRDKVDTGRNFRDAKGEIPTYRHTSDLINAFNSGVFPAPRAMITIHPQRWSNSFLPWFLELAGQNIRNQVKWLLVKTR